VFYEFPCATLPLFGPPLLATINAMLTTCLLSISFCHGVVCLLPKVHTVPLASQLCPIILLCVDEKLLTTMFVAHLLNVLPGVLHGTQLCSVRDYSFFMVLPPFFLSGWVFALL
jgi:hypothetical protein